MVDGPRGRGIFFLLSLGRVAELADALASGASGRKVVGVQVPPRPRGSRRSGGVRDRRFGRTSTGLLPLRSQLVRFEIVLVENVVGSGRAERLTALGGAEP